MQYSFIKSPGKANKQEGFTLVELLIVIVVIGILAAITVVAYTGIQQRARVVVLMSDLEQAQTQLELDRMYNNSYPATKEAANGNEGLPASPGTTWQYILNTTVSPQNYCLTGTNNSVSIQIATDGKQTNGPCPGHTGISPTTLADGSGCPTGYIVVPGSSLYGTDAFCVMKYEAKQASATVPISQASGTPWVNISQTDAITYSANVAGCSGCHLITEAEWLTIAHNVLSVDSNWSGGSVGSGYIYSGNNDGSPNIALAASSNDSDGYAGTGNVSPSGQRRTLTLTNGEVIWDMAGNVYDMTSSQITGNEPGVPADSMGWHEWNTITILGGMPASTIPSYGTPAASGWTTAQGIGALYSNKNQTITRTYLRGGHWDYSIYAGVFSLNLDDDYAGASSHAGFRVSR